MHIRTFLLSWQRLAFVAMVILTVFNISIMINWRSFVNGYADYLQVLPTMYGKSRFEIPENTSIYGVEKLFYREINSIDTVCEKQVRLGKGSDGGWNMCLFGPFKPSTTSLVYSFGINNDFSFDDAAAAVFGSTVRAFDPSMKNVYSVRVPKTNSGQFQGKVYFYPIGLAGTNRNTTVGKGKWRLRTLATLIKELKDEEKFIDYLKIDIEFNEWEVFEKLLHESTLHRVKQIGFEFHTKSLFKRLNKTTQQKKRIPTGAEDFKHYLRHLKILHKLGFRKWYTHYNRFGKYVSPYSGIQYSCCHEMVYINIDFIINEQPDLIPLPDVILPTDPLITTRPDIVHVDDIRTSRTGWFY